MQTCTDGSEQSAPHLASSIAEVASACGLPADTVKFGRSMCKVDADFTATATAGTIQTPNGDMPLTCGGQYGFTIQALFVWQQVTGKPLMTWTDASCADMTKNLTAYFVRDPYMHHLYLKGTMKEFIQTYGAACCGSLEKARDPCETTTPPITPAPTPVAAPTTVTTAPADSKHFVSLTVTMPYTKADFDKDKQDKFKVAIAAAAGTSADNVDIVSITEKRRRAGSVVVETKIRASDATGANQLTSTLGTGDTLKSKINAQLKKQSLEEATAMTAPAKSLLTEASCGSGLSATWALLLAANVVSYSLLV